MSLFRTLCLSTLTLAALPAAAQDRPSSILVLDGSGSMWGQIDGTAKITIAQEVVGDLLGSLPAQTDLGLTVYGHREKGNCADIETVVQPGPDTRAAIADAVNKIKPKGKTPLTDAVRVAAEALRYTEEKATVILVSDGRETCVADPCAVAKTLEEAGVDLTVHVVGFDVSGDDLARGQLQCLADETGGQFVMADNADQLSDALTSIAEIPAPEPEPTTIETTFSVQDGKGGAEMSEGASWNITGPDGYEGQGIGGFTLPLLPGTYLAVVTRDAGGEQVSKAFEVAQASQTVTLVLPVAIPTASVSGPAQAGIGENIEVTWNGPGGDGDFVSIHAVGGDEWPINEAGIKDGNPVVLRMPSEPGQYELRYQVKRQRQVIARTPIEAVAATVALDFAKQAEIGATIDIAWTGPANKGDFISIHAVGGNVWPINDVGINKGSPVELRMPHTPGDYEIRYQLAEEREVILRMPITITAAQVTLSAPEFAEIGATIDVVWDGPANKGDFISIHDVGGNEWPVNDANVKGGSPLKLRMPHEPGDYEIRYQLAEERAIIQRIPITVTPADVTITAPTDAKAGQKAEIIWSGPANKGDFISVHDVDGDAWPIKSANVKSGSPLLLHMPDTPGQYELRYQLAEERAIIHRVPVTVGP